MGYSPKESVDLRSSSPQWERHPALLTRGGREPTGHKCPVGGFFAPGGPRRLDAEFFRGEYQEFEDRTRTWGRVFRLGEAYSLRPGGGTKAGYDSVSIVKQRMLTNAGLNWSAASIELGRLPSVADVQESDVLIACTAHEIYYVGRRVDYVREVPRNHALNRAVSDVIVCRSRGNSPAVPGSYLAAFLRSPAGLHQVQRCIRGLRGGHGLQRGS